MDKKRKVTLGAVLLGALCLIGLVLFFGRYMILDGHILERAATQVVLAGEELPDVERLQKLENLENLDVRNIPVTPEEYERLQSQLPDCNILWNVPIRNTYYENTVTQLHVTQFYESDIEMLRYFPNLNTVDARGCGNYDALLKLREAYPDLTVMYEIALGDGQRLRENATECYITYENARVLLEMIPYLPDIRTVQSQNCTDYEALMQLQQEWPELDVNYTVILGDGSYDGKSTQLALDISQAQGALEKLRYFPDLNSVTFAGMATDCDLMYQLKCTYPDVVIDWEFELFGVRTCSTATELILNEIPMENTDVVEDALKYFYDLQWVEMCQCGIPSEEMDALWKRHPETRFVWAIPMGASYVRTDSKGFIPFKYGYTITNPFHDEEAKELKYLVDLEALDLGHMRMTDISFLQYMPKLRFLVLSDVICEDYSYIADLTELVFLEMFRSQIRDLGLLMNLKKLEDLNISWTTKLENPELLKEMTWLKRLWATANGMSRAQFKELQEALPNTTICTSAEHPTASGWRTSDRYFEMRDVLGMYYME